MDKQLLLNKYAELIHENNKLFNLTGFKNLDDIKSNLIDESHRDLRLLNVPRGTKFVDMGTGSGIPGIVLAVHYPEYSFTLVDANAKKINFIEKVVEKLKLDNVRAICSRMEDCSREYRDTFDVAISRAFAPLYYSFEFGFSFLKKGGVLYIYSHYNNIDLSDGLVNFASVLGAYPKESEFKDGILFEKKEETPEKYPRKFPVIKREAKKIPEVKRDIHS